MKHPNILILGTAIFSIMQLDAVQALRYSRRLRDEAPEYQANDQIRHRKPHNINHVNLSNLQPQQEPEPEQPQQEPEPEQPQQEPEPKQPQQEPEPQQNQQPAPEENSPQPITLTKTQIRNAFADDDYFLEKTGLLAKLTAHPLQIVGLITALELAVDNFLKQPDPMARLVSTMRWHTNHKKTILRALILDHPNKSAELENALVLNYDNPRS